MDFDNEAPGRETRAVEEFGDVAGKSGVRKLGDGRAPFFLTEPPRILARRPSKRQCYNVTYLEMHDTVHQHALLSICVTCRDGREDRFQGVRGGARLAEAVLAKLAVDGPPTLRLRGVRCMSQCKRACTVSLTAKEAFTWIFGDLDPECHVDDVIALAQLYGQSPDGFMARDARPEPMRAGVLGRLPPIASEHNIVEPLAPLAKQPAEHRRSRAFAGAAQAIPGLCQKRKADEPQT